MATTSALPVVGDVIEVGIDKDRRKSLTIIAAFDLGDADRRTVYVLSDGFDVPPLCVPVAEALFADNTADDAFTYVLAISRALAANALALGSPLVADAVCRETLLDDYGYCDARDDDEEIDLPVGGMVDLTREVYSQLLDDREHVEEVVDNLDVLGTMTKVINARLEDGTYTEYVVDHG